MFDYSEDSDGFQVTCREEDKNRIYETLKTQQQLLMGDLFCYFGSFAVMNNYELLQEFACEVLETAYETGYKQHKKEEQLRFIAESQESQRLMFQAVLGTCEAINEDKVKGPVETALAVSMLKDGADPSVLDGIHKAQS